MKLITTNPVPVEGYSYTAPSEYSFDRFTGSTIPSVSDYIQSPSYVLPQSWQTTYVPTGYTASVDMPVTGVTTDTGVVLPNNSVTATLNNRNWGQKVTDGFDNLWNWGKSKFTGGKQVVGQAVETGQKQFDSLTPSQKMGTFMDAAKGVADAWNNYQLNKIRKQQFALEKEYAAKNYANQVRATNSKLYDRQARRVAEQPHANLSVAEYMDKYGAR